MDRETVIKELLKLLTLCDNLHGHTSSKVMLTAFASLNEALIFDMYYIRTTTGRSC